MFHMIGFFASVLLGTISVAMSFPAPAYWFGFLALMHLVFFLGDDVKGK